MQVALKTKARHLILSLARVNAQEGEFTIFFVFITLPR